jgi:hypothetical protein
VDDDQNSPDVQADYTTALDQAGLAYNVWDTSTDGDPTEADLAGYSIGLVHRLYALNTFTAANEAALGTLSGRKLAVWSDYYESGLTSFAKDYLHIASHQRCQPDHGHRR